MEQVQYNLLIISPEGLKNTASTSSRKTITDFFNEVLGIAEKKSLLLDEHISADGPLIQAWPHRSYPDR